MSIRPVIGIDASRSYRGQPTGTERYSRRIIEHILQIDHPDARFRLFFNDPPPPEAALGEAEIRSIPARKFWTHRRLSMEMRKHPVDLLFVPAHVLPLIHARRSIVTIHDLGHLYEPASYSRLTRLQLQWTTKWNARQACHLIAISEKTRQDLIDHCGVAEDRITVIRHGIDEDFRPLPAEDVERFREDMRLPEEFVLYLGTVQPRKNLERLITAFERLALSKPDIHLIIAGKIGWLSEPITARVLDSPMRERIRLIGHVPDEQLPYLYNAADTFVLPSLYEGFGLPVLEAMACGVPVVMSDRGSLPELSGADSRQFDPLDTNAIAAAIENAIPERRNRLKVEARHQHARQFRWEKAARETLNVLLRHVQRADVL